MKKLILAFSLLFVSQIIFSQSADFYYNQAIEYWENGDHEEAIKYLKNAYKNGKIVAALDLGTIYYNGEYVEQNYTEAAMWYKKAASYNYVYGYLYYADCLLFGHGVKQNVKKARRLLKKIIDYSVDAIYRLSYINSEILDKPWSAAVWLKYSSIANHIPSQELLGQYYFEGYGYKKDYQEAVYWWQKAFENDSPKAAFALGFCYQNGYGIDIDTKKAIEYYTIAVDAGFAPAYHNLALCYQDGIGVGRDMEKAIYYYTEAATADFVNSQYNLGKCYEEAIGVKPNLETALYWYTKAALQGHEKAEYVTGKWHYLGIGTPINYEEAIKWLLLAADKNNIEAMETLATCYEEGKGVTINQDEAQKWRDKAENQKLIIDTLIVYKEELENSKGSIIITINDSTSSFEIYKKRKHKMILKDVMPISK